MPTHAATHLPHANAATIDPSPRSLSRSIPFFICFLLFAICHLPKAFSAPPPIEITNIEWGFESTLAAERWNPVTLWVQSRERPFSGILTVTFPQDATQKAAISLPVATTPGTLTPVELCLALPRHGQTIDFEFTGDRANAKYTAYETPSRPSDLSMPQAIGRVNTVVLVGNPSARAAFYESDPADPNVIPALPKPDAEAAPNAPTAPTAPGPVIYVRPNRQPTTTPGVFPWSNYLPSVFQPQRLPRAWMAYDAVDAVVVPAELGIADTNSLDPRSLDALRTWVATGGRLVLLAHDAGDGWTRWLPEGMGGLPITLGDRTKVSIPAELIADDAKRSPTATARPIQLSPTGMALAWKLRWKLDEQSALIAEGPAGFGWITVISIDASQAAKSGEFKPRQEAWRKALEPVLQPIASRNPEHDAANSFPGYDDYWLASAPDQETSIAQRRTLDHLVQVPPFTHSTFLVIVACIVFLAVMLGPGDALFLKFLHKRQLAWLSAILWIALASVIAYAVPKAVRQTESRLDRLVVRDILLPTRNTTPPLEASSALTAVFAGKVSRPRFPQLPDGTWWRGISPIASYQKLGGQSELACFQGAPDLATPKGTLPITTVLNQWTLRGYLDHLPATQPLDSIAATLAKVNAEWDLTLTGLPSTAKILDARLRALDGEWERWWDLRPEDPALRHLQSTPAKSSSSLAELADWRGLDPSKTPDIPWQDSGKFTPGAALRLPNVRDRDAAISTLVASGTYACLYLHVSDATPTLTLQGFTPHEQAIFRILIPLQP